MAHPPGNFDDRIVNGYPDRSSNVLRGFPSEWQSLPLEACPRSVSAAVVCGIEAIPSSGIFLPPFNMARII